MASTTHRREPVASAHARLTLKVWRALFRLMRFVWLTVRLRSVDRARWVMDYEEAEAQQ